MPWRFDIVVEETQTPFEWACAVVMGWHVLIEIRLECVKREGVEPVEN
jgi:hypothetical protein